jgi:hypothetical protein
VHLDDIVGRDDLDLTGDAAIRQQGCDLFGPPADSQLHGLGTDIAAAGEDSRHRLHDHGRTMITAMTIGQHAGHPAGRPGLWIFDNLACMHRGA